MGQFTKYIPLLRKRVEKQMTKITVNATANLAEDTPVDLGWAQANWIPSIGAPFTDTVGDRENISRGKQASSVAAIVSNYRLSYGAIFISNNVPFIVQLNQGTSTQAPEMFVEKAVARAVRETQVMSVFK